MSILSIKKGFASDHSSTSYEFLAVDKQLGKKERSEVSKLSSRVSPTARRAHFIYNVDGYDIPGGWEKLMTQYYDVMYREEYGWWTLAMAFNAAPGQYDDLVEFEFDGVTEGMGIEISKNEQRIIVTINCAVEIGYANDDYYDEDEDDDSEKEGGFASDDELLNVLAQVRQQIIAGDYRALYAVWEKYGDKNDENPPPKPKNMKKGEGIVNSFKGVLSYIE